MRCACGYTVFDQRVRVTKLSQASRWLPAAQGSKTGLGSAPFGTTFGAGVEVWGERVLDVYTGAVETRCSSCDRVRRTKPVGGGMVLGVWNGEGGLYTLMSDVADAGCVIARFQNPERRVDGSVDLVQVPVPALPVVRTSTFLPGGAVVGSTVYRVPFPEALEESESTYTLTFVDKCLGITQYVAEVEVGGIIDLYGRTGDVEAAVGDYRTSQIAAGAGTLNTPLDALTTRIEALARVGGDLAFDAQGKLQVVAIHGRRVANLPSGLRGDTTASYFLRWSSARNRWEWG